MIDLNTQRDFCTPEGTYPVRNLNALIVPLRRVVAWTLRNCVPVVSAIDSHRPHEFEARRSRPACIDGTEGQRKLDFTILPHRLHVEADNTLFVPLDLFDVYQQLIFRERTDDLFSNPKADRFLTQMYASEFIVYGIALESAVKAVVLGLISRGKRVTVLPEVCGYWDRAAADLALRQVSAKGAEISTVDELASRRLLPGRRYRLSLRWGPSANGKNRNGRYGRKPGAGKTPTPRLPKLGRRSASPSRASDTRG
jgi:nicotinamidase-related amidase